MNLLIFIVGQNLVGTDAAVSTVMLSSFRNTHDAPYSQLFENMTSSTNLKVHNISQCRQRRTEPWPQATYTKIGEVQSIGFVDTRSI